MITRDEIRALCAEHDRFMAEQASEPIRRPPVSESDTDAGLVFKTIEDATLPAPPPAPTASEGGLGLFGDDRDEQLTKALGYVVSHERHSRREELEAALVTRDRKIAELEGELREVKGMLGATLQLLGARNGPDRVVELPKNFLRRAHETFDFLFHVTLLKRTGVHATVLRWTYK